MALDPISQAVVNAINASDVVPFHRFDPFQARDGLRKLRQPRPAVPIHPMARISKESITTSDGTFRVRILQPRLPGPAAPIGAVIYFHGGGARGMDLICDRIKQAVGEVVCQD